MPNYVLTGTPGAGKTALLRRLEVLGHAVVEEAATAVIALEAAQGCDRPQRDPSFIDNVLALQRARQARAPGEGVVFWDRSPVCTLALSRYLGFPPPRALTDEVVLARQRYEPTVFFVRNQGHVERTSARRISFADSLVFEQVHEDVYRELGFRLVDVPAGLLADRVAVVLSAACPR
ncbi:AAA family ATPase [Lentzea tibetensis]|uniref:AAA family ATPase n=1 Tax=Lentzea tibetensis TaxID=2591470 RepID=A0A563EGC1_9PSEU|nr:AAA family ATPase [Lentzea tibetensis]TWP45276.1 AAA family ATPase [Lentzea tibetensis]